MQVAGGTGTDGDGGEKDGSETGGWRGRNKRATQPAFNNEQL